MHKKCHILSSKKDIWLVKFTCDTLDGNNSIDYALILPHWFNLVVTLAFGDLWASNKISLASH